MRKTNFGTVSKALAGLVAAGLLAGCANAGASQQSGTEAGTRETASAAGTTQAVSETPAAQEDNVITVAATAVPHAEILEAAAPLLEAQGYTLEVTVFDDYVQPNKVVDGGDFDANFFQHVPYLNSFNEEQGTDLVNAGGIHYEPLGLYAGKESDLANIGEGAVIAIPNDTTNEARALLLLQDNGLIKLADNADIKATINDIVENPHKIEFVELEAAQVARTLQDVSFGVLNGNYALQAGLNVSDALAFETSDSKAAETYVNIIAVKNGNENLPKIKALVDVLKSEDIKKFIQDKYQGSVVSYDK